MARTRPSSPLPFLCIGIAPTMARNAWTLCGMWHSPAPAWQGLGADRPTWHCTDQRGRREHAGSVSRGEALRRDTKVEAGKAPCVAGELIETATGTLDGLNIVKQGYPPKEEHQKQKGGDPRPIPAHQSKGFCRWNVLPPPYGHTGSKNNGRHRRLHLASFVAGRYTSA